MCWLRMQGVIQKIYIHKDYIHTTSSLGNTKYEFSQHGIASFHTPSYLEYKNYVDDPYLFAMAINSLFGNQFTLKLSFNYDEKWDGVILEKPLKSF